MKQSRKYYRIKNFTIIMSLVLLFVASFFGFAFNPLKINQPLYAVVADEPLTTLKDPNFTSSTPTGGNVQSVSSNNYDSSVDKTTYVNKTSSPNPSSYHSTAGIIDVTKHKLMQENTCPTNPNSSNENYVLMISSGVEKSITNSDGITSNSTEFASTTFGYKTKENQIKLEADSYYEISLDVLTIGYQNNSGVASLYLYDEHDDVIGEIKNINSSKTNKPNWNRYYFLVSTNALTSYNVKLGMFLDGNGTALFDNLSFTKKSLSSYTDLKNSLNSDQYIEIEKDSSNIINLYETNKNLLFTANGNGSTPNITTGNNVSDGTISYATHLTVNSASATYTLNDTINFTKNRVYKVTAYIKALEASNTTLKLINANKEDENNNFKDASVDISKNTSLNGTTNGYVAYSFYVLSNERNDVNYKLQIAIGDLEDNSKTGSTNLYVSRIIVEYCNYSNYSATNSNSSTLNLATTTTDPYLTNGTFDAIEIEDYSNPYPAKASSWTIEDNRPNKEDGTVLYGVINNSQISELETTKNFAGQSNILGSIPEYPANTNMLMLYTNYQKNDLSATSPVKKCNAGEYYKFSANVLACNSDATLSLITYKDGKAVELASRNISTSSGDSYFKRSNPATIYLYTGNQSIEVYLRLTIKPSSNNVALAFLDEAKAETTTNTEYDKSQFKADLSFSIKNSFDTANKDNTIVSISTSSPIGLPNGSKDNNILFIEALEPTIYSTQSKNGFSLETDKYYKLSLSAYTKDLIAYDDVDEEDIGASIGLTGFDKFNKIKSTTDVWTTYTFLINPSSATTTYLTIDLGSEELKLKGSLYIANVVFETIDEATFNSTNANNTTMKLTTVKTDDETPDDEDKVEPSKKPNISFNSLMYVISSALFAISIILAVIGLVTKKFKKKKPAKKTKNEYDRNKTVSKQISSRQANMMREAKLAELNAELNKLFEERSTYEQDYKRDLSTIRDLKISRAPAEKINNLNKDLKKNRKMTSAIGLNISKIEYEIEYVKSDAYLASLMRKVENESLYEEDETPQVEQSNNNVDLKPTSEVEPKQTKKTTASTKTNSKTTTKKTTKKAETASKVAKSSKSSKTSNK